MKQKLVRGFTLIELLVVIAIIGILTSVVLASLNTARGKGSNAAIKSDLSGLRAQGDIVYDNNGSNYASPNDVCLDSHVRNALDHAGTQATGVPADAICNSSASAWAAASPLKIADGDGSTYWCVDNNGDSKGETVALGTDTVCP